VKLGDVARIEDSVAEPTSVASVEGKPAVVLSVRKQSGTNTIDVVNGLKERLTEIRAGLPKGWTMQVVRDQSDFILAAVNAVKEHLILGSLFAALIVWFFLSSPKLKTAAALAFTQRTEICVADGKSTLYVRPAGSADPGVADTWYACRF